MHFVLKVGVSQSRLAWAIEQLQQLGFSAFEEQPQPWGACLLIYAADTATLQQARASLEARCGEPSCPVGAALTFASSEIDGSWALEWTKYLVPVQLTPRVKVVPNLPQGGRTTSTLYLEPALAFGYGEHPTTRLLAGWLEAVCCAEARQCILDVGTGTGVLALLGAHHGAARVVGLDTSLDAISAARNNAELNAFASVCSFTHGTLDQITGTFDCIIANIEAPTLIDLALPLRQHLRAHTRFGLSGLLREQSSEVMAAYAKAGIPLIECGSEDDWQLLGSPGSGL